VFFVRYEGNLYVKCGLISVVTFMENRVLSWANTYENVLDNVTLGPASFRVFLFYHLSGVPQIFPYASLSSRYGARSGSVG